MSRPNGLKLTLLDTNNYSFYLRSFSLFAIDMSTTTIRKVSAWNAYCSIHKDQSMTQNGLAWGLIAKDSDEFKIYQTKAVELTAQKAVIPAVVVTAPAPVPIAPVAPHGLKKNGQPKRKPGPQKSHAYLDAYAAFFAENKDKPEFTHVNTKGETKSTPTLIVKAFAPIWKEMKAAQVAVQA
jgi:hypothetical protein